MPNLIDKITFYNSADGGSYLLSDLAAGMSVEYINVTQKNSVALTGTLRGLYSVATNGTSVATGTIRGAEIKARAANSSNVGANVTTLEGLIISVDVKNKAVTDVRGIEVSLDGGAGGSATTVYGMEISNNTSAAFGTTYGLAFNFGSAVGRSAFTKDILLQNGETIDNATNGTIQFTAGVLKLAFDTLAYMTITQADGAGITFASVSDGTAGFTFSQAVALNGVVQLGTTAITALAMGGGTAATPLTTAVADKNFMEFRTQSTATSGDARGIYNRLYLAGAGGGGESLRSYTEIVGVVAASAHGAHISLGMGESTTKGSVTGLGAAVRATLGLPDIAMDAGGTYAALQAEIYSFGADSDAGAVTSLSCIRVVNDGAANGKADVDDDAVLFDFAGWGVGDGNMIAVKAAAASPNVTNSIRVKLPDGSLAYIYLGTTALTA